MVQPLQEWLGEWAKATLDHHERWDGAGYPHGISGYDISRAGRIVAVVDAFDVMTSARSYKEPISFDEARSELAAASGSHFDPEVVRAFLALSLTRRRARWSFLSWLANSPIITSVAGGSATVPATIATGMAAATVAASSMVIPALEPDSQPIEVAVERVTVDDPVPTTTFIAPATTAAPATTTTTAPATTTSTTSSTTTTTAAPSPTTTAAPTTTRTPTTTAPPPTTTAAPTTTVPAPTTTTTTTTLPTTTTTVASDPFANSFLGGGSGDVLSLVDDVSGGAVVIVDGDGDPGLTVPRSPGGLIEIDDPEVRAWRFSVSADTPIEGDVFLRLHAAIDGFQDGFAVLLVGLVECDQPSAGCTELLSGQSGFAQVGFGSDFGEVEIFLGSIDHVVPAGKHVLVTVAVASSSTHDVWLQFGSDEFPSQLLIS